MKPTKFLSNFQAAHCLEASLPPGYSLIAVRLGEWDTKTEKDCDDTIPEAVICNEPPLDIPIAQKIQHPTYNPRDPNHLHDIALLRMTEPAPNTDFIKPICLPMGFGLGKKTHIGESLIVAG